ncbi:hypothetical protein HanRHA438_Chr12g0568281 [Helianthus annuus]|nr:hypothetical protein HanRHA438_Chr12g0568281 [Helianthus annuus]
MKLSLYNFHHNILLIQLFYSRKKDNAIYVICSHKTTFINPCFIENQHKN